MDDLVGKSVCVIGLGLSGRAAIELLLTKGVKVTPVDSAQSPALTEYAAAMSARGIECKLGQNRVLPDAFDLAVVSPGVPMDQPQITSLQNRGIPVWSELEFGWQESDCLAIGITGTNGKTTTTQLVSAILNQNQRRTVMAGNIGTPLSAVADQTRELDVVTLEVSSFQLETIVSFRPNIAVLLNLAPDHLDRHGSMGNYIRVKARIFENQKPFDHAIIQWDAWQELQRLGIKIPSKVITFSATDEAADLYLNRSLMISRLPEWAGPILDLEKCKLDGRHNAENLLAAVLVGRAMKLSVDQMIPSMCNFKAGSHRCELIAEADGVKYFNDSKATNVHALCSALRTMPVAGEPKNILLIAGGQDKALDFHAAGPDVRQRVKGAYLVGETSESLRAAWSLFAPCNIFENLVEGVFEAGRNAVPGDVVLLSPACASFDMFDSYQHRGESFCRAVAEWLAVEGCGD
jgi:UDP-N-acetylmuramoylalanine--D-glutamate ligase